MTISDRLFHNLFSVENPSSKGTVIQLKVFEIFTVLYTLLNTWQWAFYTQKLSDVVLPLGLAHYLDPHFFFENNLSIINALILTVFLSTAFLKKQWRWLYMVAFLLYHIQYVVRFSQGEIPHSANLTGFSLLGLGLGGIFFSKQRSYLMFAFGFLLFFAGLGYTSAAISKLIGTGLSWPSGQHLWLWMVEKKIDFLSKSGAFEFNMFQKLLFNNWYLATFTLAFGLLTEFFGFLIWFKKLRPYTTTALIAMHIGIFLSMNIFFKSFTFALIIVGYPWNRWIDKFFKPGSI